MVQSEGNVELGLFVFRRDLFPAKGILTTAEHHRDHQSFISKTKRSRTNVVAILDRPQPTIKLSFDNQPTGAASSLTPFASLDTVEGLRFADEGGGLPEDYLGVVRGKRKGEGGIVVTWTAMPRN